MAAQDTWQILEDCIYELIRMQTAEVNPSGVLAVQPNPDGTTGIKLVSRIVPAEQRTFPQIGVQCLSYDEDVTGVNTHAFVGTFLIAVAVYVSQDSTVADTGSAALQNLRNYQNDGAGNGISPLLRANVTLLGLAQWSGIQKMERLVVKSESDDADAIATAVYTFVTHDQVRLS